MRFFRHHTGLGKFWHPGRLAWMLMAFLLFLAGCGSDDRMSTIDPKGPVAKMQYETFMVTVGVTLFLFITVGGALLFTVFIFREKKEDRDKPPPKQSHGHPLVEVSLIFVSIIMLLFIAVPTVKNIWRMHELPTDQGEILEVNVKGYQWWWAFEYPEQGFTTANELVIPKDRVVKLNLRAMDVIHSFWLPKIAGKMDLMPGRANWMWIQADEEGHYFGQCAEFCGEAHAYMLFRTDVLSEEKFDDWVIRQQTPAPPPSGKSWDEWYAVIDTDDEDVFAEDPVQDGARLFMTKGGCVQCHTIDGSQRALGVLGPNLTKIGSRRSIGAGLLDNTLFPDDLNSKIDEERQLENFYKWIAHSETVKPGNLMYETVQQQGLSEEEFRRIAIYLQTLK